MCEFSKEDVLTIARAISLDPVECLTGDFPTHYFCQYCDATLDSDFVDRSDFVHERTCPVMVAQDILTGHEKEQAVQADSVKICECGHAEKDPTYCDDCGFKVTEPLN